MFLFFVLYHFMLSGNFFGSEIRHGILWGLNFGPGIFFGVLFEAQEIFLSVDFCPHSNIPVNPEYPPPPPPPPGDQHEISPCNINALENGVVMRIKDMIREDESN